MADLAEKKTNIESRDENSVQVSVGSVRLEVKGRGAVVLAIVVAILSAITAILGASLGWFLL